MFRPPLLIPAALAAVLAAPLAADPEPGDPPVELQYDPAELPATPGASDPDRVRTAEATRAFVSMLFSKNRPPAWSSWKMMRLGPTAGGKTRAELLSADGDLHGWHWLDTAALAGLLKERGLPADAHEGRRFAVGTGADVPASEGGDIVDGPAQAALLPLLRRRAELRDKYGERHPEVVRVDRRIEATKKHLSEVMEGAGGADLSRILAGAPPEVPADTGDTRVTNAAGTRKALDLLFGGSRPAAWEPVATLRFGPTVGGKTRGDLLDAAGALRDWFWLDEAAVKAWQEREGLKPVTREGFEFRLGDPTAPAVLPGLWTAANLERFLRGELPEVERIYVQDIPTNAEAGIAGPRANYPDENGEVLLVLEGDGPRAARAVEIAVKEARQALGRFGLDMVEEETLKPVPDAERPARPNATFGGGGLGGVPQPFEFPAAARRSPAPAVAAAVEAVRDADGDAKADAAAKLDALLTDQFDAAQRDRETDLAALEAKVKRLRELHDKRAAAKAEIVARRAETLLREADGLGWGEPGNDGGRFPRPYSAPGGPDGGGGFGGGIGFGGPATLPLGLGVGGGAFGGGGFQFQDTIGLKAEGLKSKAVLYILTPRGEDPPDWLTGKVKSLRADGFRVDVSAALPPEEQPVAYLSFDGTGRSEMPALDGEGLNEMEMELRRLTFPEPSGGGSVYGRSGRSR